MASGAGIAIYAWVNPSGLMIEDGNRKVCKLFDRNLTLVVSLLWSVPLLVITVASVASLSLLRKRLRKQEQYYNSTRNSTVSAVMVPPVLILTPADSNCQNFTHRVVTRSKSSRPRLTIPKIVNYYLSENEYFGGTASRLSWSVSEECLSRRSIPRISLNGSLPFENFSSFNETTATIEATTVQGKSRKEELPTSETCFSYTSMKPADFEVDHEFFCQFHEDCSDELSSQVDIPVEQSMSKRKRAFSINLPVSLLYSQRAPLARFEKNATETAEPTVTKRQRMFAHPEPLKINQPHQLNTVVSSIERKKKRANMKERRRARSLSSDGPPYMLEATFLEKSKNLLPVPQPTQGDADLASILQVRSLSLRSADPNNDGVEPVSPMTESFEIGIKNVKTRHREGKVSVFLKAASVRVSNSVRTLKKLNSRQRKRDSFQIKAIDRYRKRQRQTERALFLVLFFYIALWLPFLCCLITYSICGEKCIGDELYDALIWCGYTSSAVNPFIYAVFNKPFKTSARHCLFRMIGHRRRGANR